jgi:hypothetical protein
MEEEQVDYKRHLYFIAGYLLVLPLARLIFPESEYILVAFVGMISLLVAGVHLLILIGFCIDSFAKSKYNQAINFLMLSFLLVICYAGSCALMYVRL